MPTSGAAAVVRAAERRGQLAHVARPDVAGARLQRHDERQILGAAPSRRAGSPARPGTAPPTAPGTSAPSPPRPPTPARGDAPAPRPRRARRPGRARPSAGAARAGRPPRPPPYRSLAVPRRTRSATHPAGAAIAALAAIRLHSAGSRWGAGGLVRWRRPSPSRPLPRAAAATAHRVPRRPAKVSPATPPTAAENATPLRRSGSRCRPAMQATYPQGCCNGVHPDHGGSAHRDRPAGIVAAGLVSGPSCGRDDRVVPAPSRPRNRSVQTGGDRGGRSRSGRRGAAGRRGGCAGETAAVRAARGVRGRLRRPSAVPVGAQATAEHSIPPVAHIDARLQPQAPAHGRRRRHHGRRVGPAFSHGVRRHRWPAGDRRPVLAAAAAGRLRVPRLHPVGGGRARGHPRAAGGRGARTVGGRGLARVRGPGVGARRRWLPACTSWRT